MKDLTKVGSEDRTAGAEDAVARRDKAMELSLKWHPGNHVQVLVEHGLLAKGAVPMKLEGQREWQRLRELRPHLVEPLLTVVKSHMSILKGFGIARDLRDLFNAAQEALEDTQRQCRSAGAANIEDPFVRAIMEFGPEEALERFHRGTIEQRLARAARSVAEVPISDADEVFRSEFLQPAWDVGVESVVDFLLAQLEGVPGGRKARHLVRVVNVMVQRQTEGEDVGHARVLLNYMGVLLLGAKGRFQGGAVCEAEYLEIHAMFSRFEVDTTPLIINQQLSEAFFAPVTLFRTHYGAPGRIPPLALPGAASVVPEPLAVPAGADDAGATGAPTVEEPPVPPEEERPAPSDTDRGDAQQPPAGEHEQEKPVAGEPEQEKPVAGEPGQEEA